MDDARDDLTILKTGSLTSAVERQLERLIVQGELAPGDRLNEIHLAAHFGTSRGPLREAMRSLQAKGFVDVIRNRGVFVRHLQLEEACEIYDLRGALFGLAGRLVAERMTDGLLARLRGLVEEMEAAASNADLDAYYPMNLEFHDLILQASNNKTLIDEYQRLVKKMHLFRVKGLVQGGGLAVSNGEHAAMLEALASGDPERAQATHWRHVQRAKDRMIKAVETTQGTAAERAGQRA